MYVVTVKTAAGKPLRVGRAYESHQAALDLAALVRKQYPGREVFVGSAPPRDKTSDPPPSLDDLLRD